MKFIDSNIIAYAFYENEFRDDCRKVIKEGGVIDTINLIEAFNIIELQTNKEIAIKATSSLLKSNIKIIDTDLNLVFESLKRSQKYKNLKFIDLVHYTAALLNNCESIVSLDKDFDKLEIPREKIN